MTWRGETREGKGAAAGDRVGSVLSLDGGTGRPCRRGQVAEPGVVVSVQGG
jgi:hypothetical protein